MRWLGFEEPEGRVVWLDAEHIIGVVGDGDDEEVTLLLSSGQTATVTQTPGRSVYAFVAEAKDGDDYYHDAAANLKVGGRR